MANDVIKTIQKNDKNKHSKISSRSRSSNSSSPSDKKSTEKKKLDSEGESKVKSDIYVEKNAIITKETEKTNISSSSSMTSSLKSERSSQQREIRNISKELTVEWLVKVYTSNLKNSTQESTDSNVYISLVNEYDEETERVWLSRENLRQKTRDLFKALFSKGHVDEFLVKPKKLMTSNLLKQVRVGHDNTGLSPNWHLHKIEITNNADATQSFTFICDRWLARTSEDGKIERTLSVHTKTEEQSSGKCNMFLLIKVTVKPRKS